MGMQPSPVPLKPKAKRRQNLFRFFSPKCNRWVELESFVEWVIWLFHEFDPSVKRLCERPGELIAKVNGRAEKYTPDLFVDRESVGEHLIEAKKDEDLVGELGERVPKRWSTISAIAQQYRMELQFMTDANFADQQIAVANWREALPFVVNETKRPNHDLREAVLDQFSSIPALSLGEISTSITDSDPSETHEVTFWAVHQGLLSIEWNEAPLSRTTLARRVEAAPQSEGVVS